MIFDISFMLGVAADEAQIVAWLEGSLDDSNTRQIPCILSARSMQESMHFSRQRTHFSRRRTGVDPLAKKILDVGGSFEVGDN